MLCASKLGEYIAQVWASVLRRYGIAYLPELREYSGNPEITGLLRAVTGGVRQCEITMLALRLLAAAKVLKRGKQGT